MYRYTYYNYNVYVCIMDTSQLFQSQNFPTWFAGSWKGIRETWNDQLQHFRHPPLEQSQAKDIPLRFARHCDPRCMTCHGSSFRTEPPSKCFQLPFIDLSALCPHEHANHGDNHITCIELGTNWTAVTVLQQGTPKKALWTSLSEIYFRCRIPNGRCSGLCGASNCCSKT